MNDQKVRKGEMTRQSLIESARKLFAKQGYGVTGVDEIVGAIGLTSGVFYSNFESKEELLRIALKRQIEHSRKLLLEMKEGETNGDWVERVLSFYLSPIHRDSLEKSCPLTTLSHELLKLGFVKKTGLEAYVLEFEEILTKRLNEIRSGLGEISPAIISLCVGAVEVSRLIQNKERSDQHLLQAKKAAQRLIFETLK